MAFLLAVPDSVDWALPEFPSWRSVGFPARGPIEGEALQADALLVWNVGRKTLGEAFPHMPKLRLLQALSAGVDHVLAAQPTAHVQVCNGQGLHDQPTAELAMALLLAATRQLQRFRDAQQQQHWDKGAYREQLLGQSLATLEGAHVVVCGFGAIGSLVATMLAPFGARVTGVTRGGGLRHGVNTVAFENLGAVLPSADAVVLVLPNTPETTGFLSAQRLALLPKHAVVVNVGRGNAVNETALVQALKTKQIACAALDVTATEPLPQDSPLWALPNCIVSPHVAGGGPRFYGKANALLSHNLAAFVAGRGLENLIDARKGY